MKALGAITTIVVLAAAATAGASVAKPQAAVWASHTVIVDLRNLPRRYTCDDLWYKFKAVLLTLGARPDVKILPYRCEGGLGSAAYSPKVQLQFSMPRLVSDKDVRWADMKVASESVRLQPGSPARIDAEDCKLLNQMRATLLPYLGASVTAFNLPCEAQQSADAPFGITVKALIPVAQSEPGVARAAPAVRSGQIP